MNDFSEIENELTKLRPVQLSHEFAARVEQAMGDRGSREGKIIGPDRFRINSCFLPERGNRPHSSFWPIIFINEIKL